MDDLLTRDPERANTSLMCRNVRKDEAEIRLVIVVTLLRSPREVGTDADREAMI